MESGGIYIFSSKEGQSQGDPLVGAAFAVTIQKDMRILSEEIQQFGGLVCSGADDLIMMGPKEKILGPTKRFVE